MTLAERARMATEARQRKAAHRARLLRDAVANGAPRKRAAFAIGVSERTATRYLAEQR